jgi:hypothetical protein
MRILTVEDIRSIPTISIILGPKPLINNLSKAVLDLALPPQVTAPEILLQLVLRLDQNKALLTLQLLQ